MASTTPIPGQQTFNTAYPIDVAIRNQLNGEELAVFYIVDSVNSNEAAQQIQISVDQKDTLSYTMKGFGFTPPSNPAAPVPSPMTTLAPSNSPFIPNANQFNFAIVIRPGTLRTEVHAGFSATLQAALTTAFTPSSPANSPCSNPCAVNGPVVRASDGALIWYCAFQNDITIAPANNGSPWSFEFTLDGVSAAAGVGSRSTQIEFQFGNILLNDVGNFLSFTRSKHVDIINHQGRSFAPLYFGVIGNNNLLFNKQGGNNLDVFFEAIGNNVLQLKADSEFVFSFPYKVDADIAAMGNYVYFGESDEVVSYQMNTNPLFANDPNPGYNDDTNALIEFTAKFKPTGTIPNPELTALQAESNNMTDWANSSGAYYLSNPATQANNYIANIINGINNAINQIQQGGESIITLMQQYITYQNSGTVYTEMQGYLPSALIDTTVPFTVEAWINAGTALLNSINSFSSLLMDNSSALSTVISRTASWNDPDFVNFVKTNYTALTGYLVFQNAVYNNRYLFVSSTLYKYFQGMYQYCTANNVSFSVPFLMPTGSTFSSQNWLSCFASANQILQKPNYLLNSAAGINSNYNPQNPWSNGDFANYVQNNFTQLCNQIPNIKYINFLGNNYLIPCQSLYDYLWLSYKISQLQPLIDNLNTNAPTVDTYPSLSNFLFKFSNIVIDSQEGTVPLYISVRNVVGYWDTDFQVLITKEQSTLNAELELGNASTPGNIIIAATDQKYNNANGTTYGSRIDFLSGGLNANNIPKISIEEYHGLNIYGIPDTPATPGVAAVPSQPGSPGYPGNPVRVRNADLLVPDGRLAVNGNTTDANGNPAYPLPPAGDTNPNEKFYVSGDSYLNGHVGISGDVGIGGVATINGTNNAQTFLNIPLNTNAITSACSVIIGKTIDIQNNYAAQLAIVLPSTYSGAWPVAVLQGNTILFGVDTNGNIQSNGRINDKTGPVMPAGSIIAYAGQTAPPGWLLCDGSAIPSQYTDLINVVGANTPNLCGRTLIGTGNPVNQPQSDGIPSNFPANFPNVNVAQGQKIWPGYTGGEYQHQLNVNEMPSHSHSFSGYTYQSNNIADNDDDISCPDCWKWSNSKATNSAGGDQPHNNMQPYYAVNYIIKC